VKILVLGLAVSLLAASAFADVHLTMNDGRVSIVAKDATVRQILAEWGRVGQARIVNVDLVPGGPQTLELHDVAEAQALEVLLRSLSGYILAPRAVTAANLSTFDRIIIMPTLAGVRPAAQTASSAAPAPLPQPPEIQQAVEDDQPQLAGDQDDERPASTVVVPAQTGRGAVLNAFPRQSMEVAPQGVIPGGGVLPTPTAPQTPVAAPRSPSAPFGGVAVPGMVAPAPQQAQPGQPKQAQPPAALGQPVRPPGGH
jgi:hypothetical protein